jgi:hypothetical protein
MRRLMIGASTLTAALLLTLPLGAQGFVGGGVTLPSGDYNTYAKAGWMVNAGFTPWHSADERAKVWAEGFYGSNSHDDFAGDKTNLYGGLGSLTYNLTEGGSAVPYLIGSVGYMVHQYKSDDFPDEEGSDGGFAFGGGAGVGIGKLYLEGRYFSASISGATTAFILVAAGITF